jgi:hypothetical protein
MRHQRALLSAKHQGLTFQAVDNLTTAESLHKVVHEPIWFEPLRIPREVRTGRSRTFPRTFQRNVTEIEFSADSGIFGP